MLQGDLFDDFPEARFYKGIWKLARKRAKATLPCQIIGESKEEYDQNLRDETRLELVSILRTIADDVEAKTLARQTLTIDFLYSKGE